MYNTHTTAESSFIRMPTFSRVKIIFPSWLSHRTFHGHCRLSLAPATSVGIEGIYTRSPVHQTTENLSWYAHTADINMLTRYHGGPRLG